MSRLTRYHQESLLTDEGGYYEPNASNYYDIVVKLGQIEDLEDELGCPLEVREKTLDSFYCPKFENDKKLYSYYVYGFDNCDLFVYLSYSKYDDFYDEETKIPLKDYKKTWWLSSDLEE